MELWTGVVEQYAEFADYARGDSPCFEAWARGVADDPEVVAWIATLPEIKQQPNLVFAAARWHGVAAPAAYAVLREALLADGAGEPGEPGDPGGIGPIRSTILARATQTNEVGRLATLVPAFAQLGGGVPLSLLEVGASAGLCLYPDRWSYAWSAGPAGSDVVEVGAPGAAGPLRAEVDGPVPFPTAPPAVAWRGGVDLNPLDVRDPDDTGWLETLVWPEHDDRRALLREAVGVAAADPPELVRGDLLEELPGLVERASEHGPVVVFHSAVIAYLEPDDRRRFAAMMRDLVAAGRCHWVSNEGRSVLPEVSATWPQEAPSGRFVLGVDGQAVAWTHGHGRSMTWLRG
ncbi:DUF2332 domain-containing protein [Nocardioides sp. KIGAM211]|uniref:DUF2332 domain-containing protein n=1 Tax=Nocardioides luti TaxID=2761101 RepID=A0A7X0RGT3_9ACTN|nr:DUF2332 domain-containing protein [Nocardioides luti]MBB6628044.1 DUF2332 domain-containing protein [Nocardioides luti]